MVKLLVESSSSVHGETRNFSQSQREKRGGKCFFIVVPRQDAFLALRFLILILPLLAAGVLSGAQTAPRVDYDFHRLLPHNYFDEDEFVFVFPSRHSRALSWPGIRHRDRRERRDEGGREPGAGR
jgi:hypothetical protein